MSSPFQELDLQNNDTVLADIVKLRIVERVSELMEQNIGKMDVRV